MILSSAATLSSILLAPLGIEGILLQKCDAMSTTNKKILLYSSFGKWILIVSVIAVSIMASSQTTIASTDESDTVSPVYEYLLIALILVLFILCVASAIRTIKTVGKC